MEPTPEATEPPKEKRGPSLYVQVLVAIAVGVLLGWLRPEWGIAVKPLGDGFVKLIKMLIGPIVFTTVAAGIAGMKQPLLHPAIGLLRAVGMERVRRLPEAFEHVDQSSRSGRSSRSARALLKPQARSRESSRVR